MNHRGLYPDQRVISVKSQQPCVLHLHTWIHSRNKFDSCKEDFVSPNRNALIRIWLYPPLRVRSQSMENRRFLFRNRLLLIGILSLWDQEDLTREIATSAVPLLSLITQNKCQVQILHILGNQCGLLSSTTQGFPLQGFNLQCCIGLAPGGPRLWSGMQREVRITRSYQLQEVPL